jgi:transposase
MRIIGLDIHRVFAKAVALEDGELKRLGRIGMTRDHLEAFAKTLDASDHAFYERVRARRGNHIAAVAVARKLTVIIWHLLTKGEDYDWVRPALHAKKIRDLELRAGCPERRGQRGRSYDYNLPDRRRQERARAEQAEAAYRRTTQGWRRQGPKRPTDATLEERQ